MLHGVPSARLRGGIASDEMRAPNELFKMPVIKLELVIKIENRENMETGAYAHGVKGLGNERPARGREGRDRPKDLKGNS